MKTPNSKFQNIQMSPMLQIFTEAAKHTGLINLGIGEPDLAAPKEVIEAIAAAAHDGYTHYPPVPGFPDLRQEICNYWKTHHGLEASVDGTMITAGGIQALNLILQAYVEAGDEVLVTDPCFAPYVSLIGYTGAKAVSIPVSGADAFVLSAEALEQRITPRSKILMLNSPGNPTGATYDRQAMEAIAKVAERHDLLVISDEIYESFVFEGEHVCFATLPGMKERTFTLGGFSKTYAMTGLRLGYIMTEPSLIRPLIPLSADIAMGVNAITQRAGIVAIRDCQYFVDDMVKLYKQRAECVVDLIEKTPGLSCVKPKGSFYLMMDISRTGMGSVDFCLQLLREAGVVMMPGIAFGETADGFVRVSCNGSPAVLEQAFRQVGEFVSKKI